MTPRIYTRAEWGARYRAGFGSRAVGRLDKWLHHSVTQSPPANATFAQDAAAVRAIEQIGQSRFGGGISYTWVIPKSGRIFEGTGVGRIGSHTGGRNTVSVGICLIGNYEGEPPTTQQLAAVVWLVIHGVARGWWRLPILTGGHRDVSATACPGRHAYAQIPEINRRGRAGLTPPPPPPPAPAPPQEDNMPAFSDRYTLTGAAKRILNRDTISYGAATGYAAAGGWEAFKRLPRIEATLTAQTAAIEALAASVGVDPGEITQTVSDAVERALADLSITLTTQEE